MMHGQRNIKLSYAAVHCASLAAFPLLLVSNLSTYHSQPSIILESSLHLNWCRFSFPKEQRIVPLIIHLERAG